MLRLQSTFGVVADVKDHEDPWGLGVIFTIARNDDPTFVAWKQKANSGNPVNQALSEAATRVALRQIGRKKPVGQPEGIGDDYMTEVATEAERLIKVTPEQVNQYFNDVMLEDALRLLRGWSNNLDEDGKPVPFSEAAARELLTSRQWVPKEKPYGGQSLGMALQRFIVAKSQEHMAAREELIEGAEKN